MKTIPLSKPDITEAERKAVAGVLGTSVLALGPKQKEFEKMIAKVAGVKYAVAVNSGTSALHLIIRALGISKGDEVITTPFSFIASANCFLHEGATPVFADIKSDTLNIDPELVEGRITSKTKAILAVDVFGRPADWDALQKIAKKHKLFLIEDSAESLGSQYKGRPCGGFGDAAIFAFYPNKQITTGEGGMVLTNNKKIAELSQSLANQGRKVENGKWLEHVRLGYNYRMDEMSAAMGIVQVKRLAELKKKRAQVATWYTAALAGFEQLEIPKAGKDEKINQFVYVVKLPKALAGKKRDAIIKKMAQAGIMCSNYFQPIHLQPFYQKEFGYKKGEFPVSEDTGSRTLALPFFNDMTLAEVTMVVKNLKRILYETV